jgi:hypothetical protein
MDSVTESPDELAELALRVVRGNPSIEELAALRMAVAGWAENGHERSTAAEPDDAAPALRRTGELARRGGWFDPDPSLRRAF